MMKRGGQMSKTMQSHVVPQELTNTNSHPLYFAINTTSKQGHYGHQNRILNSIIHLQLEIIDFRSWHERSRRKHRSKGQRMSSTQDCFYVQDTITSLPPTRHLKPKQKQMLKERVREIRSALEQALSGKAQISIKRWLPGVAKKDDTEGGVSMRNSTEFDPQDAFKQAHSIMRNFELKQSQRELARLAGGTEAEESRQARTSKSHKHQSEIAGALAESQKYGHPVENTSENLPMEDEDEQEDSDEEMSYIYGDEDSQHQKLSMVEASESSTYGTLNDDEAEKSDTTDSKPQRGMMSDTDDESPPTRRDTRSRSRRPRGRRRCWW